MDKKDNKNTSIFKKVVEAGNAFLDLQIRKSQADILSKANPDQTEFYFKSITEDTSFKINSQGYKEKPHRILDSHLKQMAQKDSIVSAVIQTRQSQISNYTRLVDSEQHKGFVIKLKDEQKALDEIIEELRESSKNPEEVIKADEIITDREDESPGTELPDDDSNNESNDQQDETDWEITRKAKKILNERVKKRREVVEQFVSNCGKIEERPYETKKWNFDSYVKALVRDRLTYDRVCTEIIPDEKNDPHHFFPVDASTIKFASPSLKKYKSFPGSQTNIDFLYPEKQVKALEESDALELDDELLEAEKYKLVQVIQGRIERAYTEDEMKVGMFNMTTDIYNNGYSISELELLVSVVSSHLNTEYYNKAYFTQGFSAKGILHLKAPIPRRKVETIRQQWHHMIKGSKNSFQTPIFAGMDEVNWIPLTQNHTDIEFEGWMNYLIKIICAIYQIDPTEIGFPMKEAGGGGGFTGDATEEKNEQSKDKGLRPLLRFIENYINKNIIDSIDSDFEMVFTGLEAESAKFTLERQEKEVKFKKTVNEVRAEDGLPPLPGMDNIILSNEYMQWYTKFSEEGKKLNEETQNQQNSSIEPQSLISDNNEFSDENLDNMLAPSFEAEESEEGVAKSLKIEYYKLDK